MASGSGRRAVECLGTEKHARRLLHTSAISRAYCHGKHFLQVPSCARHMLNSRRHHSNTYCAHYTRPITSARLNAPCSVFSQLSSLKHQTAVDRLAHLQQLLQLDPKEVTCLVLKLPSLLVYAPGKLAGLYKALKQLLDCAGQEQQHTRQLVLKWPQVGCRGAVYLCPVLFGC
jgi:hypothetical protein